MSSDEEIDLDDVCSTGTAVPAFTVGQRVDVQGYSCAGTVRFVGLHHKEHTPRVLVELDEPLGKNNGTVGGHLYGACPDNCGVLTIPGKVAPCLPPDPVAPVVSNQAYEVPVDGDGDGDGAGAVYEDMGAMDGGTTYDHDDDDYEDPPDDHDYQEWHTDHDYKPPLPAQQSDPLPAVPDPMEQFRMDNDELADEIAGAEIAAKGGSFDHDDLADLIASVSIARGKEGAKLVQAKMERLMGARAGTPKRYRSVSPTPQPAVGDDAVPPPRPIRKASSTTYDVDDLADLVAGLEAEARKGQLDMDELADVVAALVVHRGDGTASRMQDKMIAIQKAARPPPRPRRSSAEVA